MCTRTTFVADDGRVVVGRNMDWAEEMFTDLWAFAPGMKRSGDDGPLPLRWDARYGSVVASAYGCATTDGVNEKGLVTNVLFLAESEFASSDTAPTLSVAAWAQYLLDSFATVSEAVDAMRSGSFSITSPQLPTQVLGDARATVHMSVSDAAGDSAIFEFVGGELRVHHGREYRVMTNSPTFDKQLAITAYWEGIGGDVMLPGTSRGADRFVRASYYLGLLPTDVDDEVAAAGVLSVQRNAATPRGLAPPGRPEMSTTIWTSVIDATARRYYFQDTRTPNIVWVDLDRFEFASGQPARRLDLSGHPVLQGEVSARFEPAEPYVFLGARR